MTWNRAPVASALADLFSEATGVYVHEHPPETLNFPCVVIMRPTQVLYATSALSIDEVELSVAIVHGLEQEDAIEDIKNACRSAILGDQSLGGVVQACWPTQERNWRNVTGAGGANLLYVELVLSIQM